MVKHQFRVEVSPGGKGWGCVLGEVKGEASTIL